MYTTKDIKYRKLLLIQPFGQLDTVLKLETGNLLLVKEDKKIDKIPLYSILAIFIVGKLSITTQLLKSCSDKGVSVYFLSDGFSTYARCGAQTEGNYLLRKSQYLMSTKKELQLANTLVTHKILSQNQALHFLGKKVLVNNNAYECNNRESLLGVEGNATSRYFSEVFSTMNWYKRMPQAKPDELNLLLDMGYTMLFNLVDAMLSVFGFDTYKGFYHQLFYARKSLVCDVMEPWRVIIDTALVLMHRQNILNKKDFKMVNGSYVFTDGYSGRLKYAQAYLIVLTTQKEQIFKYVKDIYLHYMKSEKYSLQLPQIIFSHIQITHKA